MTAPFDPLPHLERWTSVWSCPDLAAALTVRFTPRLRTSLGRCHAQRRELRLAAYLLEAPRPLLLEVLCHEAAHAAVFALHGAAPRPHGAEWKGLMGAAGLAPRVRIPAAELAALPAQAQRARVVWDHRCPLGHARRLAGRPMRRWRCVACRSAGLSGVLVIERTTAEEAARTPFPAPLAALSSAQERPRTSRGLNGRGLERLRRAFGGAPHGRASP